MSIHAMDFRCCPVHGEQTLHHLGACCRCHPLPEPRVKAKPDRATTYPTAELTEQEAKVASYVARGMRHKEIAAWLGISRNAVQQTVHRGCARMGFSKTYELVRYVRERAGSEGRGV